MAISLDGRIAFPSGGKTQLGGKADRRVLENSLAWSDGMLFGGGTLRAHQNVCLIHNSELINKRKLEGKFWQPTAILVSSKSYSQENWSFFAQPIERWLITPKQFISSKIIPKGYKRQIKMQSDWRKTMNLLFKHGMSRIVLLGGAKLTTSLLESDQIDELQLTITPKIIGGKYTWVHSEINTLPIELARPESWILTKVESLENNELMINYIRKRELMKDQINGR